MKGVNRRAARRRRRRELVRQWLAAGVVTALAGTALVVVLSRGEDGEGLSRLEGPFPTRRLSYRPISLKTAKGRRVPGRIRVLRTGKPHLPGRCVSAYRRRCVERLELEDYVAGVVLAEEGVFAGEQTERKGHRAALQAAWRLQAIAARSYALYAILADKHLLKKTGFHITDSTWDQVYTGRRVAAVTRAVQATRGRVLTDRRGRLVYAEYSASCGGRGTRDVIRREHRIRCHPRCRHYRYRQSSHFRGMCQWGSFLFALEGRRLPWLLRRYYPHTRITRVRYR
jgi:peptidoglycan hydrolase-like amidase